MRLMSSSDHTVRTSRANIQNHVHIHSKPVDIGTSSPIENISKNLFESNGR